MYQRGTLASLARQHRRSGMRTLPGDKVVVGLSPYNVERGRIVYRHKEPIRPSQTYRALGPYSWMCGLCDRKHRDIGRYAPFCTTGSKKTDVGEKLRGAYREPLLPGHRDTDLGALGG